MRPQFLISILLIALLALALLLWRRPAQPPASAGQSQATIQTANPPATANTAVVTNNSNNTSQTVSIPPTNSMVGLGFRNNTNEIRQYLESENVPVAFFGKVIDQDGNPISNARVQGQVLHVKVMTPAPFGASDEILPIDQETDAGGQFEIQNLSGRSFNLNSIQKDGYEVEPNNCPHDFASMGGTFDNPIIFKMWSTNIHEKLITGKYSFKIVPDGRPYFINLTAGTISESAPGDLKVWIQYTNHVVPNQLYDWSTGIDVINGGLQDASDYAMWMAPADGYIPTFQESGQIKGYQKGDTEERHFYLELKNGQEYGRMNIELIAPYNFGIPGLVRLSYAINPSGSRILR